MALNPDQLALVDIHVQAGVEALRSEVATKFRGEIAEMIRADNAVLREDMAKLDADRQALAKTHNADIEKVQKLMREKLEELEKAVNTVDANSVENINRMKSVGEAFELSNTLAIDALDGKMMLINKESAAITEKLKEAQVEIQKVKDLNESTTIKIGEYAAERERNIEAIIVNKEAQLNALALTIRQD